MSSIVINPDYSSYLMHGPSVNIKAGAAIYGLAGREFQLPTGEQRRGRHQAFAAGKLATWMRSANAIISGSADQALTIVAERHEKERYATRFFRSAAKKPSVQRKADVIYR
jgi:hypothetical protein